MTLRAGLLALSVALAACAPPRAPAMPGAAGGRALDDLALAVDHLRREARIPGLSIAVVAHGEIVLARGFGAANVERHVAATADTPYNVGSVTKPISVVVALRLVELGRIDLDRPMSTYRGFREFCADFRGSGSIFARDFRCDSEPLTLRHVLSHTVQGRAGERFSYDPPVYSWASRPLAEAGRPFSELVAEYVFAPAGMARSARIHRGLPLRPDLAADLAQPYHLDEHGGLVPSAAPPPQGDGAAGGVISTAQDLARFDLALDGGRLLTAESRDRMMRPAVSTAGVPLPYGLGWFVEDYRGERLVWHSGLWEKAYSALYLKVPRRHLTLILLANSDGLRWDNPLDRAEVERSPFAAELLSRLDALR
jgi:CubicO group peptidase (beta-lactamase class C family)